MGLAIVKRLVLLLGHRLEVASRPGRGTVFRIGIADRRPGRDPGRDLAAADTLPMPSLQPRTVLVVDDEEPIRDGLRCCCRNGATTSMAAGRREPGRARHARR